MRKDYWKLILKNLINAKSYRFFILFILFFFFLGGGGVVGLNICVCIVCVFVCVLV